MNQTLRIKVINWDMIVAYAAQAIQKSKTKINNGSNIILIIAPIIIEIIANFGFHSALIIEFNAIQSMKNGIQSAIIHQ